MTGANRFVDSALCATLNRYGVFVRSAMRTLNPQLDRAEAFAICDLSSDADWRGDLRSGEQVVYSAARVNLMNGAEPERRAVFRAVNVDGTSRLVRQAVAAGVKRFVSISSVKVNGESTLLGCAFIETDVCNP